MAKSSHRGGVSFRVNERGAAASPRSWPQAALISTPFSTRTVQATPRGGQLALERERALRAQAAGCRRRRVGFTGIRFTWQMHAA